MRRRMLSRKRQKRGSGENAEGEQLLINDITFIMGQKLSYDCKRKGREIHGKVFEAAADNIVLE